MLGEIDLTYAGDVVCPVPNVKVVPVRHHESAAKVYICLVLLENDNVFVADNFEQKSLSFKNLRAARRLPRHRTIVAKNIVVLRFVNCDNWTLVVTQFVELRRREALLAADKE